MLTELDISSIYSQVVKDIISNEKPLDNGYSKYRSRHGYCKSRYLQMPRHRDQCHADVAEQGIAAHRRRSRRRRRERGRSD
jgi:hypothetical protein